MYNFTLALANGTMAVMQALDPTREYCVTVAAHTSQAKPSLAKCKLQAVSILITREERCEFLDIIITAVFSSVVLQVPQYSAPVLKAVKESI